MSEDNTPLCPECKNKLESVIVKHTRSWNKLSALYEDDDNTRCECSTCGKDVTEFMSEQA